MKFFLTALISALLATQVVPARSQQAGDQSNIPSEEYAIYAAVISNMFTGDEVSSDSQSGVRTLVIEDRTVRNEFAGIAGEDEGKRMKQKFSPTLSQETIDDYVAKRSEEHTSELQSLRHL